MGAPDTPRCRLPLLRRGFQALFHFRLRTQARTAPEGRNQRAGTAPTTIMVHHVQSFRRRAKHGVAYGAMRASSSSLQPDGAAVSWGVDGKAVRTYRAAAACRALQVFVYVATLGGHLHRRVVTGLERAPAAWAEHERSAPVCRAGEAASTPSRRRGCPSSKPTSFKTSPSRVRSVHWVQASRGWVCNIQ